jgi:phage host-nuclease inhibitor protein Gam
MAEKCTAKPGANPANAGDRPAPPVRVRTRLQTIGDVERELARLYREAPAMKVDTQDASRLANLLFILSRLIEESDLEKRLDALERTSKEKGTWSTRH